MISVKSNKKIIRTYLKYWTRHNEILGQQNLTQVFQNWLNNCRLNLLENNIRAEGLIYNLNDCRSNNINTTKQEIKW